jgi:starch-binding outer membrane protein, SusD/RagB family
VVTGVDVWNLNPAGTSTNSVQNLWAQAYYTINICNLFMDGMATKGSAVVGSALSANYLGEARLIRALSYYSLLQLYARPFADGSGSKPGLPLRLTGIKGSGFSDLARSSVSAVYTQILNDLNFAETNLPTIYAASGSTTVAELNTTRAHRNTAIALKTRVYLSMQNYGAVITEANKIVAQNTAPFSATSGVLNALQPNITTVFLPSYNTTESIFSLPMTTIAGDVPGTQNQLGFYFVRNGANLGIAEYSLNPSGIVADASWGVNDIRRTQLVFPFNNAAGKKYVAKYQVGSPYTDYPPVIRYAEVLLNLAEALARNNYAIPADAAKSLALVNFVRQRSDVSVTLSAASQAALISVIMTERRIELLGEGLRNNDLMRLLQTIPAKGSVAAKGSSETGYIWPISSNEMSLNRLMTDN